LALSDVRIYEFDWGGAERELLRALELDPNSARAHQQRADLLMALERYDEAVVAIDRARTLDPFSSYIESRFARVLYRARRYHEALPHVERSIELDPNPGNAMPYWIKGELFNEIGRYEEAIANLERARNEGGRALDVDATIAGVYARMGNLTQARRIMAWLRRTNDPARLANAPVAYAYAALGEIDRAFDVLFRLVEDRQSYATQIKADPPLAKLHADPRWQMLLRKMNLATVSATSR
jgi:tetratricopeptide (TPR) repeat protein